MRKYTLVFSVIAHLGVIAAIYIAPAFATDELPEPPRTTAFIIVRPIMPDPPPVAIVRNTPAPSNAAPIEPPDGVKPEPPVAIESPSVVDPGAIVGGPSFDLGPVNDVVAAPPPPQGPKKPVPVGGIVQAPKKIADVAPIYPPIALAARKEGLVILQAVIDEDGLVREVKVLRSDPLFDQSAMDAVKQWRFTRPTLNGQPIPVVMTVTVGFSLTR
jgi:periplasmic protein TonB